MVKIRFDCENISVNANDTGSLSVEADIRTLIDSDGLLRALVAEKGLEYIKKLLDIELKE